jgi:hypothetical protein
MIGLWVCGGTSERKSFKNKYYLQQKKNKNNENHDFSKNTGRAILRYSKKKIIAEKIQPIRIKLP